MAKKTSSKPKDNLEDVLMSQSDDEPIPRKLKPSPKKMKQTKLITKIGSICDICAQIVDTALPDSGYNMVSCSGCKLGVHKRCAGEAITNDSKFKCWGCSQKEKPECKICGVQGGFMNSQSLHITCALMCDRYSIADYSLMTFTENEEIKQVETDAECQFCKSSKGFKLRCLKKGCKQVAHAYCLIQDKKKLQAEDEDIDQCGWEVEFKLQDCNKEQQGASIAFVDDPDFFEGSFDLKQTFTAVQAVGGAGDTSGQQKQKRIKSKSNKDAQNNKLPSKTNFPLRGGKISVVCEDHRSDPRYCICNSIYSETSKCMIMCDCCQMWYHASCIGLQQKEVDSLKTYNCKKCIEWAKLRTTHLMPAIQEQDSMVLIPNDPPKDQLWDKKQWPVDILPNEKFKMKLLDILIISQVWELQVSQIESFSVTSDLIREQFIRGFFLPSNQQHGFKILNSKVDKLAQYERAHIDMYDAFTESSILPVVSSDGIKLEDNLTKNKEFQNQIDSVIKNQVDQFKLISPRCEELFRLKTLMVSQEKLCSVITGTGQKLSQIEVDVLRKELGKQEGGKSEMKIQFEKIMKEARDWITQTRDFTMKNEVDKSLQEISKTFESKKTIAIAKELIQKANTLKIEVTEQLNAIQSHIQAAEDWENKFKGGEGIRQLVVALKEVQHIKCRSDMMAEVVKTFKSNQDWILQSQALLSNEQRKYNQVKDLEAMVTKLKGLKSNIYADTMLKQHEAMLKDCLQIEDQIKSHDFDLQSILDLKAKAKILTVRPESYRVLKDQEVIVRWLTNQDSKCLPLDEITKLISISQLNEPTQQVAQDKLKELNIKIEQKIIPLKKNISNNKDCIETILTNIKHLEDASNALTNDFQYSDPSIQTYKQFKEWLVRTQTAIDKQIRSKSKISPFKSIEESLVNISKDNVSKIVNKYQPSFSEISAIADLIYNQLRSTKSTKDCQDTLSKNKINLKKLEQLLQKSKQIQDPDKQKQIQKQIAEVNAWYSDFKEQCHLTESVMKKELRANALALHEKAVKLIERKNQLKLELSGNEEKVLLKARKWGRLVADADILMKDKTQTKVTQDRIYEIKGDLDRMKSLDDIECVGRLKQELKKLDEFHQALDSISNVEEGVQIDRSKLEEIVGKYSKDIKINISGELDEINDQLKTNADWEARARSLIEDTSYDHINEARSLLQLFEGDKENYQLLLPELVHKVQVYLIKAKYQDQMKNKKDVVDFLLAMEKDFTKLKNQEDISDEIAMLELAKKIKKTFIKQSLTVVPTKQPERVLTLEDANVIVDNSKSLPFLIDKRRIDSLKKEIGVYQSDIMAQAQALYQEVPPLEKYDQIFTQLQTLSFVSPDEVFIKKMKAKHQFIMDLVQRYPPTEVKEDSKEDQSFGDSSNPRFVSEFSKAYKKFNKLKCQCPEGQRLIDDYLKARDQFDQLKQTFSLQKINSPTFRQLAQINQSLSLLRLDFEEEELSFRKEIWQERIRRLVTVMAVQQENKEPPEERICSEQLKLWFEEGQELEQVNDPKYEKLSEIVEDIDNIGKALKICLTVEEVEQISEAENRGVINITGLVNMYKLRLANGELPKCAKRGDPAKRTSTEPIVIEYLRNLRQRARNDDANEYTGRDVEMEGTEQDEDEETDLEDEKDDDPAEEGEEPKKTSKKKKSSAVPASTSLMKGKPAMGKSRAKPKSGILPASSSGGDGPESEKLRTMKEKAKKLEGLKKATKEVKPKEVKPKAEGDAPKVVKKVVKKKPVGEKKEEPAGEEATKSKIVKPSKAIGGGIKLGGGLKGALGESSASKKPPVKGILKKKFESPTKVDLSKKEDKMEVDGENIEETTDGSETKKKSSLLQKRPLSKSAPSKEKIAKVAKKEEAEEEEIEDTSKVEKKASGDKGKEKSKKPGLIKKTGGGGLAASLAKMK